MTNAAILGLGSHRPARREDNTAVDGRTDYYDDANAPEPNSVVPAAVGCVTDDQGRLLLEHRVDNDLWALPGGTHEFGESILETVIREIRDYRASIQAVAFQMDRGEYRMPGTHVPQGPEDSSVLPFPTREER